MDGTEFERVAGPFKVADLVGTSCLRNPDSTQANCYLELALEEATEGRFFRVAVVQNTPKDHNGQGNPASFVSLDQDSLFK